MKAMKVKKAGKSAAKSAAKSAGTATLSGSIQFIYAKDFDASLKFYGETLGLKTKGKLGDNVRIFGLPGSALLGVVREGVSAAANPPKSAKSAGVSTCIVGLLCKGKKEVDAFHKKLKAAKVPGMGAAPEQNDTFGLYNFICNDPAGYLVEVQSFLKPLKV